MKINKIEAAKQQLDSAIFLLFNDKEPVAIHSLICSAWRILKDLLKSKSSIEFSVQAFSGQYTRKEIFETLNKVYNFSKHADSSDDPESLFLNEKDNDCLLMMALYDYSHISELTWSMQVFQLWHYAVVEESFYDSNNYLELKEMIREQNLFPTLERLERGQQKREGLILLNNESLKSEMIELSYSGSGSHSQ